MKFFKTNILLYLHQYFHFPDEPGSIRSYTISKFLVKQGYKVIVLSLNNNSKYNFIRIKDNIVCVYIPIKITNKTPYFLRILIFIMYNLISLLVVFIIPSKIIFCTSTPLNIAFAPLLANLILGKEFLFEVRDVWPEVPIELGFIRNNFLKKILFYFEEMVYQKSKGVITLSVDMKNNIENRMFAKNKFFKNKDKEILLIPNFPEHKIFEYAKSVPWRDNKLLNDNERFFLNKLENWKLENNLPTLLYAGTLGFVNNPYLFKDLIRLINNNPKIRLILCLTGSYQKKIIEEIKNNIYFFEFPFSSKYALTYVYQYADCGISFVRSINALFANSANKYFDCLAAGKPLLINHYGWQYDELISNNCGFFLDQHNLLSSYNKLVDSMNNRNLMDDMSLNSYLLSKKYYSESTLIKLEKFL